MKTRLFVESKTYNIAYLGGENPLPIFSDEIQDFDVSVRDSMSTEDTKHLGWDNGRSVLPYKLQDRYTREISKKSLKTVVLENRYLRAEILPELGARLFSLYDKEQKRELLFKNPNIYFGNLAIRNAWFAGGIEWNIGKLGHSYFTSSPVYVAEIRSSDSSPGMRIYEYERRKGLFWQVDLYLPEDSRQLFCHVRIENTTGRRLPMYWWTNIAVTENEDVRVLAPAQELIYLDHEINGFGKGRLPYIEALDGKDATYPGNYEFSSEIFYQCQGDTMPWEVAIERDGYGFLEASTMELPVRKMFCWGRHQGGSHWKEFLSQKGSAYIELQMGRGKTQQHSVPMESGEVWEWTELFGPLQTDPSDAYSEDWEEAVKSVERSIHALISPDELYLLDRSFTELACLKPLRVLHRGSGWGALEIMRCEQEGLERRIPASLVFPVDSIHDDEEPWLELLKKGILPSRRTNEMPGAWMVQEEWIPLLERSLSAERDWFSLLHYGVMLMENGKKKEAKEAWMESTALEPSCWSFRNLGQLALLEGNILEAHDYMKKAWDKACEDGIMDLSMTQEYLSSLCQCRDFDEALSVFETLPEEMKNDDRIRVIRGRIAFEKDDFSTLSEILQTEFACIREGETELTDLWFGMWEKKLASERNVPVTDEIRDEVRREYRPPQNIDFRSFKEKELDNHNE